MFKLSFIIDHYIRQLQIIYLPNTYVCYRYCYRIEIIAKIMIIHKKKCHYEVVGHHNVKIFQNRSYRENIGIL